MMSAMMTDLIEERITPKVGNAASNAAGKLLKVIEMEQRYGESMSGKGQKVLRLSDETKP